DASAPRFSNYLDEFLQAIRVFGFLEKPVFHELARHLQTRRLIAGDTLALDQDLSFYCVVDGHVQVFTETGRRVDTFDDESGGAGGYQLLNEVGPGGTLSSLFTILSLFTEDVQISWQDNFPNATGDEFGSLRGRENKDVSHLDLTNDHGLASATPPTRQRSVSSSGSTTLPATNDARFTMSPVRSPTTGMATPGSERSIGSRSELNTPASMHDVRGDYGFSTGAQSEHGQPSQSVRQGTIARATVDTTLAVIPAEAFRRLTQKFPKASAHIVQVILTRFSRVTFHAIHKYLGLTVELLRTEKSINDLACHPLPNEFYSGGGMQRLRQRFASVPRAGDDDEQSLQTEDDTVGDSDDYFGRMKHHRGSSVGSGTMSGGSTNIKTPMPRMSLETARPRARFRDSKDSTDTPQSVPSQPEDQVQARTSLTSSPEAPFKFLHPSRLQVHAGDLHTMAGQLSESESYRPSPASRAVSYSNTRPGDRPRSTSVTSHAVEGSHASQATTGMDFDLRDEVMSSIAKSIGLIQPPLSGPNSAGPSPTLRPFLKPSAAKSPFSSSASATPSSRNALRNTALFGSSFGNLSYLQSHDDASSITSLAGAS
ncbi:phosphatidylcholine and lysophosphatidylcholine phospholipase, partial [Ceratobasidium sp. 394]